MVSLSAVIFTGGTIVLVVLLLIWLRVDFFTTSLGMVDILGARVLETESISLVSVVPVTIVLTVVSMILSIVSFTVVTTISNPFILRARSMLAPAPDYSHWRESNSSSDHQTFRNVTSEKVKAMLSKL